MFRKLFLTIALGCFGFSASELIAQDSQFELEGERASDFLTKDIREYFDADDDFLVEGQFRKLDGTTVKIMKVNGKTAEFKLNEFCENDQKYIRKRAAEQRKFKKDQEKAIEIVSTMKADAEIGHLIRSCNRLRKLGLAAKVADGAMERYFDHEDERLQRAAFLAYAAIGEVTKANYNKLIDEMRTGTWGMREAFENHPDLFLMSLVRFDEFCLSYLQHAAFTGRLKLNSDEPSLSVAPVRFVEARSQKNQVRAGACQAIGELGKVAGVNILLDLLPVAETPVGGKRDDKTVEAIIVALGTLGVENDEVVDAFQRLKDDFPDAVEKGIKEMKKARDR